MAFLFKRNPKTPQDLVRAFNELIAKLDDKKGNGPEECGRLFKQVKGMFYGDDESEVDPSLVVAVGDELEHQDLLILIASNLGKFEFDSRQDAVQVFAAMMRRTLASLFSKLVLLTGEYLVKLRPEVILILMKTSEDGDVGLVAGLILRDCCKYEPICNYVLSSPNFWHFFSVILGHKVFEVANDAFSTVKFCLTQHPQLALKWLVANYDMFVHNINLMITCQNYVFKRSALKFVLVLVQTRDNQQFLTRYFDDSTNLKVVMMSLNDSLRNLAVEAFNLFKYFVAKPKKNQKVLDIVIRNKKNFMALFEHFDIPANDPNLVDEMSYVVKEIRNLPDIGKNE